MKKSFETVLYSVGGVVVMLLILIAFNFITATMKQRVDLTKEKAYTLSAGTRAILKKLDTPVKIRFYYSSSAELTSEAMFLKSYARQVQDLLAEFKQAGGGKLVIEQFDPKPDSDAEDSAQLDGVEGQALPTGERFYLGACVSLLDTKETIPFFRPDRERLLEYDLASAISRVVNPEKPAVGIMSGLPVFGMPSNPMMAQMGQRGQEPWALVTELNGAFTVKQVDMTTEKIDDDIKVLVVIHPRDIPDKAQFAIDQFLMRGGKLVAFLDAVSVMDRGQQNPMMGAMPGGGTSLPKLLKAWGIQFDTGKAVADMNLMNRRVRLSATGDNPTWISVKGDSINKDDVVTSEIDDLWIPFCGAFTGTPVEGLKETVLLKSSKNSMLVEAMLASMSGDSAMKDFKPSGTEYALAIRLTGKFKTAFPEGAPEEKADPGDTNKPPAQAATLKESKSETAVVLVGNSDMISDQFSLQQVRTPFGNFPQRINGNLNLAQNIVENLGGDSNLINVRSRATMNRPFTRIEEMQAKAEEVYRAKIQSYEDSLQETRQKLSELQRNKDQNQRFILSPEQQAELTKLQEKEASTRIALKEERKKLRNEIDAMQNKLKWGNIIGMPLIVAFSGIGLAVFKRKRTSAK